MGRRCYGCGKTYHRVNKVHMWPIRNPGHREGWMVQDIRLCTDCLSPKMTLRIMTIAQVRIVKFKKAVNR